MQQTHSNHVAQSCFPRSLKYRAMSQLVTTTVHTMYMHNNTHTQYTHSTAHSMVSDYEVTFIKPRLLGGAYYISHCLITNQCIHTVAADPSRLAVDVNHKLNSQM